MRKKEVKIPLYFGKLIIIHDIGLKNIKDVYGIDVDGTFNAIAFNRVTKQGLRQYAVAFGSQVPNVGTIAHEVVHIVNQIFIDVNIRLDLFNDEAQAYLTGWISNQIANFIYQKDEKE